MPVFIDSRSKLRVRAALGRITGFPLEGYPCALVSCSVCLSPAPSVSSAAGAGVPPTAGFAGKILLFAPAIRAGHIALVLAAVIASAVGAYYYLRVLVVMFMTPSKAQAARIRSPWLSGLLGVCAVLTLVIGVQPDRWRAFAACLVRRRTP